MAKKAAMNSFLKAISLMMSDFGTMAMEEIKKLKPITRSTLMSGGWS